MPARNRQRVSVPKVSIVLASSDDEAGGRRRSPVYCVHCEGFVEPKIMPSRPLGTIFVLAGVAALFGLPALENHSTTSLILVSLVFGAACALYVALRRPDRNRVCGLCGSPYIYIIEDHETSLRRAA